MVVLPGVFALKDGEEDPKLEGVNDSGVKVVKLFLLHHSYKIITEDYFTKLYKHYNYLQR
jgi:hypothetical protein